MSLVTLITPGGGRPEAFVLCEKYVARQTYKGAIQWIVADDNPADPVICTMGQEHVFGDLVWKPGFNTQRYNMAAALPLVKGDYVLVIENDDYFHPEYIENYVYWLEKFDIVGTTESVYYSLRTRGYKEMKNFQHCSTTQTAFRKSYLPQFERALHSGQTFFDIELWNTARNKRHNYLLASTGKPLCIGMKGLPGRYGVGVGHTDNDFISDPNFVKLKELVGDDAKAYISMVSK